jgi:hypothetical protein
VASKISFSVLAPSRIACSISERRIPLHLQIISVGFGGRDVGGTLNGIVI